MKRVVDAGFARSLFVPGVERLAQGVAARVQCEIDDGRGAAHGGRARSTLEIVRRERAAERHVEMCVRIDAAREHIRVARVDDLMLGVVDVQTDGRDRPSLNQNISAIRIGRRYDGAAVYKGPQ